MHDQAQEQEISCLFIHKNKVSHLYAQELLYEKEIWGTLILGKFWNSLILLKYLSFVWPGFGTRYKMPLRHINLEELF